MLAFHNSQAILTKSWVKLNKIKVSWLSALASNAFKSFTTTVKITTEDFMKLLVLKSKTNLDGLALTLLIEADLSLALHYLLDIIVSLSMAHNPQVDDPLRLAFNLDKLFPGLELFSL